MKKKLYVVADNLNYVHILLSDKKTILYTCISKTIYDSMIEVRAYLSSFSSSDYELIVEIPGYDNSNQTRKD